jgi:hypothetical protein
MIGGAAVCRSNDTELYNHPSIALDLFLEFRPAHFILNNLQTMQSFVAPTESGLALTVRGRGPDVVLIHGSLGDLLCWMMSGRACGTD